jgi:hypothetical protein
VAKQELDASLFYDGTWHAAPVYARDTVELERGAGPEGSDSPPSSVKLTLDNRTRTYNPRNAASPLFGLAGRNTPLQLEVDGAVRATVEAASWRPQRSVDGRDAWTPIEGGGIMRRLEQGASPLHSPAYRALVAPENDAYRVDYWPLEEEQGASSISSPVGSATPIVNGTINYGGGTSQSSERLITFGTDGSIQFPVRSYAGTEHKLINLWRVPDTELPDLAVMMRAECAGGTIDRFDLVYSTGFGMRIEFYSGETRVETLGPLAWINYIGGGVEFFSSIELRQNGANIDVLHLVLRVPTGLVSLPTDTVVGHTLGRIVRVTFGATDISGAAIGQFAVGSDTGAFPNYISPTNNSLGTRGYEGERAGRRAIRLGDEEGVTVTVVGDPDDTERMGPQPALTFMELIRECVRTDAGLLFEPIDALELAFRTGRDLYNRDPVLSIPFTGGIRHPLAPDIGDRLTRNDVTAKRRGGGTARAVQLSGALNVQPAADDPEGVGRYEGQVDVNNQTDARLVDHAGWWLHRGTVDEPRYPSVTVDLDAAPGLVAAVEALDIGDRFEITGLPVDESPEPAVMVLLGTVETLGTHRRTVTLNGIPAAPWEIGIVGDNAGTIDLRDQRVATELSTLDGGVSSSATALVIDSGGVAWTTNPSDWNPALSGGGMYLVLAGERVRVTNITGAGSSWTLTVVRAVNGVVKAHADGTPVRFYRPVVVAL